MEKGARALGVKLLMISASNDAEIDAALQALRQTTADGVVVSADLTWLANRAKVARAVREAKLPTVFPFREFHEFGALISYSPNQAEAYHRLATYVDRVLKGANPAELPIEQISTYEVVVDLRIAREMHIKVPQELLYRADQVIR
jgi:putative ABC transport system substrate-binding protein